MNYTSVSGVVQKKLDITPTPKILQLLENLAVEPWRCVAELVDNSLDDFRRSGVSGGVVSITVEQGSLIVSDNGSGMNLSELENALRAGYSSKSKVDELGLFGVGFNVACARLGRRHVILTKKRDAKHWTKVVVDLNKLIQSNTYLIEPEAVKLSGYGDHGTVVVIELNRDHLANFERSKYQESIAHELGRTYSYILRNKVPGLTGEVAGNPRQVKIMVSGKMVAPRLPCIWSESRSVTYKGATVSAVQKFERHLPEVTVCESCGHWHARTNQLNCERCGSASVKVSSRRVWGWIGVQRYMDRLNFGLSFIRNGRTILFQDKQIFTFNDPATGESYKDYPVEWPADMGRIVGEVHCDHVRVDFIKREFVADDPNWQGVLEIVRGNSSLQPKRVGSAQPNGSPLALIFNAYRINEPGTRYLIPGNGQKATHDTSRGWADKFYSGDISYFTDERWFDAASAHDGLQANGGKSPNTPGLADPSIGNPISPINPGGGAAPDTKGVGGHGAASPNPPPPPIRETMNDKMARWESGGVKRVDLCKRVSPPCLSRSYEIEAWETYSEVLSTDSRPLAAFAVPYKGDRIKVYAYKHAEVFLKYGRSSTDMMIMEVAQQLKALTNADVPISQIFEEILSEFPDEERSETVLRVRIAELNNRLQTKLSFLVVGKSKVFWEAISHRERDAAEASAVSSAVPEVWSEAIKIGGFVKFLSLGGVKDLVVGVPSELFDGKMFKQHYATVHAAAARDRSQGYVAKALGDLAAIAAISSRLSSFEIGSAELALQFLDESLQDGQSV